MSAQHHGRRITARVLVQACALCVAAIYVLPLLFVITTAVTPLGHTAGSLLPTHGVRLANFRDGLHATSFGTMFVNSALVTVGSTVIQVFLACLAGYALARIAFRGRELFFLLLIAILVIPPEVTLVPLFVMTLHIPLSGGNNILGQGGIGLLNTIPGLMIPHIVSALSIFLMRQFYIAMPEELADAARIDGAGEWTVLWRIFTPMAWPAVITIAIFAFQGAWNDFLWPLVITKSNNMQTVQLGLTVFFQQNATQWPLLMSCVILISIPVIVLFLLGQRTFQEGVATGAVKE